MTELAYDVPWRVGTKLGRTLYEQPGPEPSPEDEFLGLMEDSDLAAYVVRTHNDRLASSNANVHWPEAGGPT